MSRWITKQLSLVTLSLFGPFPRSILQPRPIRRISRQIRFSFSPSLSPRRQGNAGILPKSKAFLFRFFLPSPVVALSLTPIYILFSAQKYPLSGHPLFFSRLFGTPPLSSHMHSLMPDWIRGAEQTRPTRGLRDPLFSQRMESLFLSESIEAVLSLPLPLIPIKYPNAGVIAPIVAKRNELLPSTQLLLAFLRALFSHTPAFLFFLSLLTFF